MSWAGAAGRAAARSGASPRAAAGSRHLSVGGRRVPASYAGDDRAGEIVARNEKARRRAAGAPEWALDDEEVRRVQEAEASRSVADRNRAEGGTYRPGRDPFAPTTSRAGSRPRRPPRGGGRLAPRRLVGAATLRPGTEFGGIIAAVLVWCWVILPALEYGPKGPLYTLRAKFFNKDSKGEWLP